MKKGGSHPAPIVELPTHPHFAMNPTTKALLRNAVIEAVNTEQDAAAAELLAMLNGEQSTPAPLPVAPNVQPAQLVLPSDRLIIDGPARDYHYWANVIRESFIPFMVANGRHKFTSGELYSWLENGANVQMTAGDIELRCDGKEYWRNIVSDAIRSLKGRGLIDGERGSRVCLIPNRLCGELRSLALLQ